MSKEVYTSPIIAEKLEALQNEGYTVTVQIIRHDFTTPKNEYFTPSEDIACYLYHDDEIADKVWIRLENRWSKRKEVFSFVEDTVNKWYDELVEVDIEKELKEYSRPDYDIANGEYL